MANTSTLSASGGRAQQWDTDPYGFQPKCVHCDDQGCDRCCETAPATLEDFEREQQEEEMAAERARDERRTLENEVMAEHFRKYPNG